MAGRRQFFQTGACVDSHAFSPCCHTRSLSVFLAADSRTRFSVHRCKYSLSSDSPYRRMFDGGACADFDFDLNRRCRVCRVVLSLCGHTSKGLREGSKPQWTSRNMMRDQPPCSCFLASDDAPVALVMSRQQSAIANMARLLAAVCLPFGCVVPLHTTGACQP